MTTTLTADRYTQAQQIVAAYGDVLAHLPEVAMVYPLSRLRHDKDSIRQSIQTLLWDLEDNQTAIRNSLTQAYVILEQFIEDDRVEVVRRGQSAMRSVDPADGDWEYAEEASQIMVQVKLAMENALQDIQLFLQG